jgi:hypothetical protein
MPIAEMLKSMLLIKPKKKRRKKTKTHNNPENGRGWPKEYDQEGDGHVVWGTRFRDMSRMGFRQV